MAALNCYNQPGKRLQSTTSLAAGMWCMSMWLVVHPPRLRPSLHHRLFLLVHLHRQVNQLPSRRHHRHRKARHLLFLLARVTNTPDSAAHVEPARGRGLNQLLFLDRRLATASSIKRTKLHVGTRGTATFRLIRVRGGRGADRHTNEKKCISQPNAHVPF